MCARGPPPPARRSRIWQAPRWRGWPQRRRTCLLQTTHAPRQGEPAVATMPQLLLAMLQVLRMCAARMRYLSVGGASPLAARRCLPASAWMPSTGPRMTRHATWHSWHQRRMPTNQARGPVGGRKGADRRRGLEASCFQLLASMTKGSEDSKVTGPAVGANSWHRCSDTVMFPTGHEATGSAVAGLRKRQSSTALVCRGI